MGPGDPALCRLTVMPICAAPAQSGNRTVFVVCDGEEGPDEDGRSSYRFTL